MGRKPKCKCCKRIVLHTSRKGNCLSCSKNKMIAVTKQMKAKKGKYYKKWKHNLIKAITK